MSDETNTLRAVAWREIFPWLILRRCFGLAIRVSILALATLGVLLTPLGWWLGAQLFLPDELREATHAAESFPWPGVAPADALSTPLAVPDANVAPPSPVPLPANATASLPPPPELRYELPHQLGYFARATYSTSQRVLTRWLSGWQHFLALPVTVTSLAYLSFGGLWTLAVWAFCGGAIARIAVADLGRDERVSLASAVHHVRRRYLSYLGAPLLPLAGILAGLALLALLGLIMRSEFGVLLAGLLWIFVLLGAFVLAVLLIGLAIGWPLKWVALGAEIDGDAFEAVSRGYTYAFQRPLRLLGYLLVALLLGSLGWLLVYHFSEILLALARETVLWSAGDVRALELAPWFSGTAALEVAAEPVPALRSVGGWLIGFGNALVRSVAVAYGFSYFFCAAAAIYLLLRRDIDEKQMDDVFSEDEEAALELPPMPRKLTPAVGSGAASVDAPAEPQEGGADRQSGDDAEH